MEGSKLTESDSLRGCEAAVTGGCRGIGRAIAEKLFSAGAQVTVLDLESAIAETDLPSDWRTEVVDYAADEFEDRVAKVAGTASESSTCSLRTRGLFRLGEALPNSISANGKGCSG